MSCTVGGPPRRAPLDFFLLALTVLLASVARRRRLHWERASVALRPTPYEPFHTAARLCRVWQVMPLIEAAIGRVSRYTRPCSAAEARQVGEEGVGVLKADDTCAALFVPGRVEKENGGRSEETQ